MRRSVMLVLVAALMLTSTVGATASVAAGPSAEAQAAAGRGRRRAARCGRAARGRSARCRARRRTAAIGRLPDGNYEDASRRVRLTVTGSRVNIGMLAPMQCPIGGALIQGDGTIARSGAITVASGIIASSALRVDWTIVVRQPALSYSLETSFAITLPGTAPCTGRDELGGVLSKR